jgi:hypothetical protein
MESGMDAMIVQRGRKGGGEERRGGDEASTTTQLQPRTVNSSYDDETTMNE